MRLETIFFFQFSFFKQPLVIWIDKYLDCLLMGNLKKKVCFRLA